MSKWPIKKLDKHIIESKEQYGSEKLNGIQVLSVTNDQGFVFSDKRTSENVSNYKIIKNGYFAYNPYRINVGSLAFAGDEYSGIVSPAYVVFSCAKDLNPEYLWKYLKSDVGLFHIRQGGKGSVRSSLSFERLQEIEIPLPPLSEQKRIVKKINEVEIRTKKIVNIIVISKNNADILFKNYLKHYFNKDKSSIKSWGVVSDFFDIIGGTGFPKEFQGKSIGDIPFYKVSDMNNDRNSYYLNDANNYISEDDAKHLGARIIPAGSLVFPKVGGAIATNKRRITSVQCIIDNNLMALSPKGKIDPGFTYLFFLGIDLKELQRGSSVPAINQDKVGKINFPDINNKEREEIIQNLNKIKNIHESISKEVDNLYFYAHVLMPSVLSKAFNGEL